MVWGLTLEIGTATRKPGRNVGKDEGKMNRKRLLGERGEIQKDGRAFKEVELLVPSLSNRKTVKYTFALVKQGDWIVERR